MAEPHRAGGLLRTLSEREIPEPHRGECELRVSPPIMAVHAGSCAEKHARIVRATTSLTASRRLRRNAWTVCTTTLLTARRPISKLDRGYSVVGVSKRDGSGTLSSLPTEVPLPSSPSRQWGCAMRVRPTRDPESPFFTSVRPTKNTDKLGSDKDLPLNAPQQVR